MTPPPDTLYFIHPRVLKRLRSGQFVPSRQSKVGPLQLGSPQSNDRRHVVSPLAVTKRCIPYQPAVFFHRNHLLLQLADALNTPQTRVLLLDGPAGMGKTSVMRGLVEMMGSENEQVLWFDINPHSTVDDMVRFFIEYLEQLSHLYTQDAPDTQRSLHSANAKDRLRALKQQFQAIAHIPILIVLDHIEHQVNEETDTLRSNTLRELLNFLLGFANLKLCIVGQTLPHQDITAQPPTIIQHTLSPLPANITLPWLHEKTGCLKAQLKKTSARWREEIGNPWQLNAWQHYVSQQTIDINHLYAPQWLLPLIEGLPEKEQPIARLFSVIRHPLNIAELCWMTQTLSHTGVHLGKASSISPETITQFRQALKTSPLRPWLKRFVPPQTVLLAMHKGVQPQYKPAHEFQMSALPLGVFQHYFQDHQRQAMHEKLSELYLKQKEAKKNNDTHPRILTLSNAQLIHEARYHQEQARLLASLQIADSGLTGPDIDNEPFDLGEDDTPHASHPSHTSPWDWDDRPPSGSISLKDMPPIIIQNGEGLNTNTHNPESTTPQLTTQEMEALGLHPNLNSDINTGLNPTIIQIDDDDTGDNDWEEEEIKRTIHPTSTPSCTEPSAEHKPSEQLLAYRHQYQQAVTQKNENETRQALFKLTFQAIMDQHQTTLSAALKKLQTLHLNQWEQAHFAYAQALVEKQQYQYRNAFTHLEQCEQGLSNPEHLQARPTLLPDDMTELPIRAQLYEHRGDMHTLWENPLQAAHQYTQCLEQLEQVSLSSRRRAEITFKLAQSQDVAQQHEKAWAAYHQSIQLNQDALQDAPEDQAIIYALSSAYTNIAYLCAEHQQWPDAHDYFTQALHYDRLQGNAQGQFDTLIQLGQVALKQNLPPDALHYFNQALDIATQHINAPQKPHLQAYVYQWLAEAATQQGNPARANQLLKTAKQLSPELFVETAHRHTLTELTQD